MTVSAWFFAIWCACLVVLIVYLAQRLIIAVCSWVWHLLHPTNKKE